MTPNQLSPQRLTDLYKLARFSEVDGTPRNKEASELARYLDSCGPEQAKSAPAEPVSREAVALRPMAWFTDDYGLDKSATTYDRTVAERWRVKGWPVTALYTAPPSPDAELVELLREERNYRRVTISCQLGMVERCLCLLCRDLRIDAKLASLSAKL